MNNSEELESILAGIDTSAPVSTDEPARQYYFIKKCREIVKKKSDEIGRQLTACSVTFGCQMNARDSEKLLGILREIGYEEIKEEKNADLVLMNTCTVRDNADQRVYGRLGVLKGHKQAHPDTVIALCGCMMQEPSVIEKIRKSYPFVDLMFGTHNIYRFAELLYMQLSEQRRVIEIWTEGKEIVEDIPVSRKYPFKSGVNIMFGCNNFCSYCIVPHVRGRERSREAKEILAEIRALAKSGVREIMLLGQNVNSYGRGLEMPITFAQLLREVEKIEGIERIRFMTSHPKDLSDELIAVMRDSKKICRHLHLPLQSGSSRILQLMNRRYDQAQYLSLAKKIRAEIPDIAITTDIIVGFPTETKEDIDETMKVIEEVQFDNAFTFVYSKRSGTPAAAMIGQVDKAFVKEQFDRVLKLVQETSKKRAAIYEGRTETVLVEEVNEQNAEFLTGRMSNNLLVHFKASRDLIGTLVPVKLVSCRGFYYIGELCK